MTSAPAEASAKVTSEERMISSKSYVEQDSQVTLRVGPLGISLDSVVIAFQQGHSAETIQQLYPALSLEEVYGAIAFYLANRDKIDQYLERQEQLWDQAPERAAQNPSEVVQRLRAIRSTARRQHEPTTLPGRQ
jgi:uncharacterized protein (DUF433 family)